MPEEALHTNKKAFQRSRCPGLDGTVHKVWRAKELMIPGILMCSVAMPGPFLKFMSPRNRLLMRIYQGLLYVGFGIYEAYRLVEFVEEFMRDEKTSLICFFHSLLNTFLFPFIYIYVARKSERLYPLLKKCENGSPKFVNRDTSQKLRVLTRVYLGATAVLIAAFHTLNAVRTCHEISWHYRNRTFPVKAVVFMGKMAHHFVLQTMYSGLESLTYVLVYLLWLQYKNLSAEIQSLPVLSVSTLAAVKEKYRELCIITEATADFFNSLLFLFYFRTGFDFTSSVIYYGMQVGRATKRWVLAYEGTLVVINLFHNTVISEVSGKLAVETNDTLYAVSKVPIEPKAHMDLLLFLEVYRKRPECMTGCGVLKVDRALLFKLCGSTVTIVLILLQLDPNLTNKVRL